MTAHFIQNILSDEKERVIVRSMIEIAHSLGVKVVMEGVETRDQLEMIVQLGCDAVQGFYLYRPMPASETSKVLKQQFQDT